VAFRVFNLLADGNGALDWQGLPLICGWLGVQDVEGLMHRLAVIKTHRKQKDEHGTGDSQH
jgi:hypothetical protein